LEKLAEESFEGMIIDFGVWVEKFKVDIDEATSL